MFLKKRGVVRRRRGGQLDRDPFFGYMTGVYRECEVFSIYLGFTYPRLNGSFYIFISINRMEYSNHQKERIAKQLLEFYKDGKYAYDEDAKRANTDTL